MSNYGECTNSIWHIFGFTLCLFIIQLNLNSIMHHKFSRQAQQLFSVAVPLTLAAFLLAAWGLKNDIDKQNLAHNWYDYIGLLVTGTGVFIFNLYKEKEQRASIEEDN